MKKENPVKYSERPMSGKPNKSKFLRPKVSIVYTAGIAKSQLTIPVPIDTRRALGWVNPALTKIWVESDLQQDRFGGEKGRSRSKVGIFWRFLDWGVAAFWGD